MNYPAKIDLHMHTTVSDGTDTPEEILERVKEEGIDLFSVTDHDALKGCVIIGNILKEDDPSFITGVEFSCKDEEGQYHILGYGYDPEAEAIQSVVKKGHGFRMNKVRQRLDYLADKFGFEFKAEDLRDIFDMDNPGKPHIGNLMVRYGYAATKEEAITKYINGIHFANAYVRPEEAIRGIIDSGGIPVLAHPSYGSGDQIIVGREMEQRLQKLMDFGLQGVEAFYSGFTEKLQNEILGYAEKYSLYATAGSDYHGRNKMVPLGDNNLGRPEEYPEELLKFLDEIESRIK